MLLGTTYQSQDTIVIILLIIPREVHRALLVPRLGNVEPFSLLLDNLLGALQPITDAMYRDIIVPKSRATR